MTELAHRRNHPLAYTRTGVAAMNWVRRAWRYVVDRPLV